MKDLIETYKQIYINWGFLTIIMCTMPEVETDILGHGQKFVEPKMLKKKLTIKMYTMAAFLHV